MLIPEVCLEPNTHCSSTIYLYSVDVPFTCIYSLCLHLLSCQLCPDSHLTEDDYADDANFDEVVDIGGVMLSVDDFNSIQPQSMVTESISGLIQQVHGIQLEGK